MTPTRRTAATPDPSTAAATGRRQPTKRSAAKPKPKAKAAPRGTGDHSVVAAVKRDLTQIAIADKALATSGLAATALALAREMDKPENSATSKSMCAGQLRDTLARLRELAPVSEESDDLDDLARRREKRLAGLPGATA